MKVIDPHSRVADYRTHRTVSRAVPDEAEQAVLGGLMLDPKAWQRIADKLTEDDFSRQEHRTIFAAVSKLAKADTVIDVLTVENELQAGNQLANVGGLAYLASLANNTPSAANIGAYADIVLKSSRERLLRTSLVEALQAADAGRADDVASILSDAQKSIKPTSGFEFVRVSDMELKPAQWVIRDYLERGTTSEIFGDPETLKSFIAVDMACCAATGTGFHGHAVEFRGPVFLIVGEGFNGISRRLHAWAIRSGITLADIPVFVSKVSAAIGDPESVANVRAAIGALAEKYGTPAMIVIDTLARNYGDGDENSTSDMNKFISGLDTLRDAFNCAMLVIHHTGHADKNRARGAMALRGSLDFEYKAVRDESGVVTLTSVKSKDHEKPMPISLLPRVVELGQADDQGQPVTSIVLETTDYVPPAKKHATRGKNQTVAIQVLNDLTKEHRLRLEEAGNEPDGARVMLLDWRQRCAEHGINRRRWPEVLERLQEDGKVSVSGTFVSLV